MILNIRHIGFQVKDLDSAIAWYEKLGFRLQNMDTERWYGMDMKIAKFFEGLELVQTDFKWPVHGAFMVDSFPDALDGITAVKRGGYEVKFAHDEEGNRLEFVRLRFEEQQAPIEARGPE